VVNGSSVKQKFQLVEQRVLQIFGVLGESPTMEQPAYYGMGLDRIFWFIPYDPHAPPVHSLPFFKSWPELIYVGIVILIAIVVTSVLFSSESDCEIDESLLRAVSSRLPRPKESRKAPNWLRGPGSTVSGS